MKKILLLSLLAVVALFVIVACAPKEGGEEGTIAGKAQYGGQGYRPFAKVASSATVCGNNVREGFEACDGTDLAEFTCEMVIGNDATGTLACANNCANFDASNCVAAAGSAPAEAASPDEGQIVGDNCFNTYIDWDGPWAQDTNGDGTLDCLPFSCLESPEDDNPTIPGQALIISASGQQGTNTDFCESDTQIAEQSCSPSEYSAGYGQWNTTTSVTCPEGTTCQDSDGIGGLGAVCQ